MNKRKIPPPPFMQGGKIIADGIVRNEQGYPLDENGDIDLVAVKKATLRYTALSQNNKQSNFTPPKKKRK